MRVIAIVGLALAFVLLLIGEAVPAPDDQVDPVTTRPEQGMYVYEAYCVACHGSDGGGDGPISDSLFLDFGVRPTNLGALSFQESRSDEQIALAVLLGGEAVHKTSYMPAWDPALAEGQVANLVAYVRRLRSSSPPKRQPTSSGAIVDTLELGRFLYVTRCLACHGPEGHGDGPFLETMGEQATTIIHPPDLGDYEDYLYARSDQNLETTIVKGFEHTGWPAPQEQWWDRALAIHEIRALIFYLRTLCIQPVIRYGSSNLNETPLVENFITSPQPWFIDG